MKEREGRDEESKKGFESRPGKMNNMMCNISLYIHIGILKKTLHIYNIYIYICCICIYCIHGICV